MRHNLLDEGQDLRTHSKLRFERLFARYFVLSPSQFHTSNPHFLVH
jgi:hypothetical protein